MLPSRIRRSASFLLLLGFFVLFTHEALPGHAQEHAKGPCRLCEFWAHQTAIEPTPAVLPTLPDDLVAEIQVPASRPQHLFEVIPHLRGPPAPLQTV
jgi:hypothetical protein